MTVRRGDVVLIDYLYTKSGSKVRPVVVIQNDSDNQRLLNTIVAQVTSTTLRAAIEATQFLVNVGAPEGRATGLRYDSVIN